MLAQLLDHLRGKRIVLLGFGREGRSSLAFLRRHFPVAPVLIADRNPIEADDAHAELLCGENYLEALDRCELCIKSPGISLRGVALARRMELTCQSDLFLRFAPCVKVGVTGSKGKTTTATLIYDMLATSGTQARLIGNMGLPVLDYIERIEGEIAVMELSSHQLEFCTASPQIAVWTNLYEEHLDHYNGGFAGYAAAKAHICTFQSPEDVLFFNAQQYPAALTDISACKAQRVPIAAAAQAQSGFLRTMEISNPRLRGEHNRQDVYFAAAAAQRLGATEEGIRHAVEAFQGNPHRLEPIGDFGGIHWVDDCIATIPRAVLCSIDALGDVDSLILGGLDRGLDYNDFVTALEQRPLRNLICLPDTGHSIAGLLRHTDSPKRVFTVESLEEAVALAFRYTEKGKSCLLSPAAASYNRYKDFEEKGLHFARLVRAQGNQK
ncbi:MAG: UDP-N-acetylmuramoyl-L-alanine--D-glutamate ligase [Oscillospiraceae bacterium]|jgi:UDP-N-acetylmuramoylalanine--D-glutamate ligase|nr:UDP-N-acetylmuramoyl-L-alanine--D-glutamate ligase [Oscillospiraceae bacterium]